MGEMIPISLFIVMGMIFSLFFYFRHKTRQEIQTTIRTAIESGQELTPEVLERLSESLNSKFGDLRRGVISIAIGIAFFFFAMIIGSTEENARSPLMAISIFPFLVGIAYVGLWQFTKKKET